MGIKFPVLFDTDKKVTRLYDMGAMPATLIVDRKGRVRFSHLGYESGVEGIYEKNVRDLLKD
jgi:alkyl hydroperoxide reductase subunit AhpC